MLRKVAAFRKLVSLWIPRLTRNDKQGWRDLLNLKKRNLSPSRLRTLLFCQQICSSWRWLVLRILRRVFGAILRILLIVIRGRIIPAIPMSIKINAGLLGFNLSGLHFESHGDRFWARGRLIAYFHF